MIECVPTTDETVQGNSLVSAGISVDEVFSSAPQKEPYYVNDGAPGPTLPCNVRPPYSDRGQYEIYWSRYHNGQLRQVSSEDLIKISFRHVSRNEKLHDKEYFELMSNPTTGEYDLRIKMVSRSHVEGSYQCTVLDPNSGEQYSTDGANVVALGELDL